MKQERGFTLIEMIIALMVGALVSLSLGLITKTMSNEASTQQMIVEASQSARTGLDMIRMDLMRTGMFAAANPRNDENVNSMVSSDGPAGTQAAYYRNVIVHLNPGTTDPDSIVLVGNFIGDRTYEAQLDLDDRITIDITSSISAQNCLTEFNPKYAFVHIINSTGQTHEAKIATSTPTNCNPSNTVCNCSITVLPGELIDGAFGERHVKVSANQALLYRVENRGNRRSLIRYFIDYDGSAPGTPGCTVIVTASDYEDYSTATVVAQNVVDFQVWFRAIDPGSVDDEVDRVMYHDFATIAGAGQALTPPPENVIVGRTSPADPTTGAHLSCASAGGSTTNISPQHVRSAIISLAVRTEYSDESLNFRYDEDTDNITIDGASALYENELRPSPAGRVGFYRVRRYTVEVPLPNITSKMSHSQWMGAQPVY